MSKISTTNGVNDQCSLAATATSKMPSTSGYKTLSGSDVGVAGGVGLSGAYIYNALNSSG